MNRIIGISACTKTGVIGNKGMIPWNYPEEYKYFYNTVKNHTLVMGRVTYQEMLLKKSPLLQNQLVIVFTNNTDFLAQTTPRNIKLVNMIQAFMKFQHLFTKDIYMLGGAKMTKTFLDNNLIDKFLISYIHKEYHGDTYFPLHLLHNWEKNKIYTSDDYDTYEYIRQ